MKSFFAAILDGLTFTDLAGQRRPRTYAVFTLLILILLATLAACLALEHKTMMEAVQVPSLPLDVTLEPVAVTQPIPAVTETCPTEPGTWDFLDILPGDNFKRIEPTCVYENLSKSVAWALAIRSGYTRSEAATALGFTKFPMHRLDEVIALTNTKGPLSLAVSFTPPHPDFAEWRVTRDGRHALVYALRGCYRTFEVVGNRTEAWNADFPVICVLSEDSAASHIIFQLGPNTFTSTAEPTRSFGLFGYDGNGHWIWLGTQQTPKVSLTNLADALGEAQASAALHDLPLWDIAWLGETYDLLAKPLPEDWPAHTLEADRQAILKDLNAFLSEVQP